MNIGVVSLFTDTYIHNKKSRFAAHFAFLLPWGADGWTSVAQSIRQGYQGVCLKALNVPKDLKFLKETRDYIATSCARQLFAQ